MFKKMAKNKFGLPEKMNTPANNKKLEKCVMKLKSEGKSKEQAIRICKASIMGSKKLDTTLIDLNDGKEVKKKKKAMSKIKKVSKKDEAEVTKVDDIKKDEAVEEAVVEETTEDETVDETVDESVDETEATDEESSEEAEAEEASEDDGEVTKGLDPIAVLKSIKEMDDVSEMQEAIDAALEQLTKVDDEGNRTQPDNIALDVVKMLTEFKSQLTNVEALVKAQDAKDEQDISKAEEGEEDEEVSSEEAPAEDAEVTEDEGTSDDASADESADEDGSDEEATEGEDVQKLEKVVTAKVDKSFAKFSDELKEVVDVVKSFDARMKAIENAPTPSKVQSPSVVSKAFDGSEDSSERLAEINKELGELEKVLKTDPAKYQRDGLAEKAFQLINEKERLQSGL